MTDARQTPEDPVIKHVRQQHNVEPPAHLDAFILNAANRETPVPKPSLWQRWLKACQKLRWQVAFASLVGVALMLSLVPHTPEPQPQFDFAPAAKPAAPLARKQAPEAQSLAAPPAAAMSAPAPMMEMAEPMQSDAISADEARLSKRAAPPANGLDEQLREVLRLRDSGQSQAADALYNNLHKRYPGVDLDRRLEKIRQN
ncbi:MULTISPECIES: hypothetical protein [unclassified Pseudomonas]|jgi:hypothetical protein|uniref:hypothetical protein n=1 Tax=unclassified Pseudomonas TaxID=196821 RepID=UPI000BC41C64|nr:MULTISPECIES: hypothetical protein [unclassified Pseudomonas]SNY15623.1 hypothetical protein SAMN05660659_01124 [Pseudomonas sp. LAMO17WK12:I6]SNY19171.1 hypothetical protein SAMN05660455_01617 [Pseudomonas sp. LAMO17WK12:I5]